MRMLLRFSAGTIVLFLALTLYYMVLTSFPIKTLHDLGPIFKLVTTIGFPLLSAIFFVRWFAFGAGRSAMPIWREAVSFVIACALSYGATVTAIVTWCVVEPKSCI
jgi:hypothetical protein